MNIAKKLQILVIQQLWLYSEAYLVWRTKLNGL